MFGGSGGQAVSLGTGLFVWLLIMQSHMGRQPWGSLRPSSVSQASWSFGSVVLLHNVLIRKMMGSSTQGVMTISLDPSPAPLVLIAHRLISYLW